MESLSPYKIAPRNITTVASAEDASFHGIILSMWDNILGPQIQHAWLVEHKEAVSHDVLNYASGRMLNSSDEPSNKTHNKFFVLAEKGIIVNAVIFSGNNGHEINVYALSLVLPYKELKWYMPIQELCTNRLLTMVYKLRVLFDKDYSTALTEFKSMCINGFVQLLINMGEYRLPPTIDINHTVFAAGQENQLDIAFVRRAIASHLQTCGCSIVIGKNIKEVNMVINTLALFLTPSERQCSCFVLSDCDYQQGLYLQGLVKSPEGFDTYATLSNNMRSILTSEYPTSLIDITTLEVKQTPLCNEHYARKHLVMTQELQCLWVDSQEELLLVPFTFFQTVEDPETMVRDIMTEIHQLHPGSGVREAHIEQFQRILERKALAMIKYVEEETNKGSEDFKSSMMKRMRQDLNLLVEGDWKIILAVAEKLKPGIYSFVFGDYRQSDEQRREPISQ
ncbi:guanine nucleotide exchange factor C9orf72-like isoform X2 [Ptychodera flava]|uniref:guanine nucleotide exchange factor C9orf72-like isoform X2 n=1 Tax=Ptychodera flava TaxID=63121 RepID=UPI00396A9EB7